MVNSQEDNEAIANLQQQLIETRQTLEQILFYEATAGYYANQHIGSADNDRFVTSAWDVSWCI